ncbi:unnamed protein product [Macrosiphum euphorbiae]|uniref:Uncharacterized protein n=1 Tax=Macrosiphum euphorbiae TaxID=13131 RepID=A0AAV0Y447_9HEMI|nr:unnamed protein product [Macrosiphum euphorbiae]
MPTTPIAKPVNTRSQSLKMSTNDDILKAINSLSTSQLSQFQELRTSISGLTSKVADLATENAAFRTEISDLRTRIDLLESRPVHPSDLSSVIFRESTERSKIEFNSIAYGVPESSANTAALRSEEDLHTLSNLLNSISIPVPTEPKLIRLGNSTAKKPRPLKIICQSKNDASQLIYKFNSQIRNGVSPTPGFRVVRDKTTLERDLLRQAHIDLEQKKDAGSTNLTISFVNGVPTVVKAVPKNTNPRGSNHRPNTTQPIH